MSGAGAMITLYHCVSARSFRPLWMLEELGAPYDLVMLPFPPRVQATPYLQDNPLGSVPLLVDGTVRMSESVAMLQYLAHRHAPTPLAVAPGEEDFAAWLNFLFLGEATLTVPQTLVLRYSRFEPEARRAPQIVSDYTRELFSRLKALEPRFTEQEFLCAGRFTAADISVGYALMLAELIGLGDGLKPGAAAYWARLKQRDAYSRALAAQHEAALAQGVSPRPATESGPPAG